MFKKFNAQVDRAQTLGTILPTSLHFLTALPVRSAYRDFRRVLVPIIKKRRAAPAAEGGQSEDFLPFVLDVVDDDKTVADLLTIIIWSGLWPLQSALINTILDIFDTINSTRPPLAHTLRSSLHDANLASLNTFNTKSTPWTPLLSAIFESLRLSAPITSSSRLISFPTPISLASDPSIRLPRGRAVRLSPYHAHRQETAYSPDAATYRADRFLNAFPEIGSTSYITWGLAGPHMCPGRWFAQTVLCVAVKQVLERWDVVPSEAVERAEGFTDGDQYVCKGNVVERRDAGVTVRRVGSGGV